MLTRRTRPHWGLQGDLDRYFSDFFVDSPLWGQSGDRGRFYPPINVWETDEHYFVEAELPGVALEDLDLTIHGDTLTLKGKHAVADPEQATELRRERREGEFQRTVQLPGDVDAERVQARMRDGVLTVELQKAGAARPRKIEVVTAGL